MSSTRGNFIFGMSVEGGPDVGAVSFVRPEKLAVLADGQRYTLWALNPCGHEVDFELMLDGTVVQHGRLFAAQSQELGKVEMKKGRLAIGTKTTARVRPDQHSIMALRLYGSDNARLSIAWTTDLPASRGR